MKNVHSHSPKDIFLMSKHNVVQTQFALTVQSHVGGGVYNKRKRRDVQI